MASASRIKAGKAYVEMAVDDSAMQKGLRAARAKLEAFAEGMKSIGVKLLGIGAAITAAFAPAIKAAADMETTVRRFNAAFGRNAQAVDAWADNYAKAIGRSKREILDLLAITQNEAIALDFDPSTAMEMSKILTTLALDWSSFTGAADGEVLQAMQAALSGSTSALAKYGIAMSDAAIAQQLMQDGINPDNASEQQKAMARLAVIMRQTAQAQGEAARGSEDFHAVTRGLRAQLTDLAGAIGKAVLPVVVPYLQKLRDLAKIAQRLVEQNAPLVRGFFQLGETLTTAGAGMVAGSYAARALAGAMGFIGSAAAMAVKVLVAVGAGIGLLLSPIGLATAALVILANHFINFRQVAGNAVDWVKSKLGELTERVGQVVSGMRDALVAGDLKLAANILWLTLQAAWYKGIATLEQVWADYGVGMVKAASDAFTRVGHVAVDAWAAIKKAWYDARDWFDGFFSDISIKAADIFSKMTLAAQIAAIAIKKAFDWSFDAGKATAEAMLEYGKKQANMTDRRNRREQRKGQNNETLAQVERDAIAQKSAIEAAIKKTFQIIAPDRDGDRKETEDKLAKAMRELEQAIADAAAKRGALPVPEAGQGKTQFGQADIDRIRGNAQAAAVEAKTSVAGSFNASALGQMFGSITLEQRTVKAAEDTARNTDDMARMMREGATAGGIAFA